MDIFGLVVAVQLPLLMWCFHNHQPPQLIQHHNASGCMRWTTEIHHHIYVDGCGQTTVCSRETPSTTKMSFSGTSDCCVVNDINKTPRELFVGFRIPPSWKREGGWGASSWAKNSPISELLLRTQVILLNKRLGLISAFSPLTFMVLHLSPIVLTLSFLCSLITSVNLLPSYLQYFEVHTLVWCSLPQVACDLCLQLLQH